MNHAQTLSTRAKPIETVRIIVINPESKAAEMIADAARRFEKESKK